MTQKVVCRDSGDDPMGSGFTFHLCPKNDPMGSNDPMELGVTFSLIGYGSALPG